MPAPGEQVFRVLPKQVGLTVTAALRQWLAGQPWSAVQKLLASRRVMVSGNLCLDAGRRLTLADVVKILSRPMAAPPTADALRIRHLDDHVVVVEKPAGMTTLRHGEERDWPKRRRQLQPTLDESLAELIARRHKGRRRPRAERLRPVHRIDRETSGLVVFARSAQAERILGEQFRQHTVHRRYLAVVWGNPGEATIRSRLVRDRGDGRRGSGDDPEAKEAVTHVRPIERLGPYTLVECRLETGRTHQIRIHLSERGHPLCGDKVYRQPQHKAVVEDRSGAERMALHAAELGFVHPESGETLTFETPLPRDMRELVDRLRREAKAARADKG